ncbi:anti-sigma factor family protein [Candidatus Viadribacter manganicus]|uniref:Putative zinc-finger domain-containing protein n=1 Tax=Candidatus Viadribacter manganicus TaxID=1759059 RepID=A0A1B1AGM1_9PROT|nr:zf-HC2 domain-containing protein [Candidatus Viadribacter manganicus]ANP45709.1 hypothetical protein ATE48_07150 [Candidatus Viadribacter manganicus]
MLDDDLLSAYLDGELSPAQRIMVEHKIRHDPAAAARLERMAGADAALKSAFDLAPSARADGLEDFILKAPPSGPAKIGPVARYLNEHRRWRWGAGAAAMSMALICGMVLGDALNRAVVEPYGVSVGEGHLLDQLASGESAQINGARFEPILSVRTASGDFCRQFRLDGSEQRTDVLACKGASGSWRMIAATPAPSADLYVAASGGGVIDAAIARLGAVEALDGPSERQAINDGWR